MVISGRGHSWLHMSEKLRILQLEQLLGLETVQDDANITGRELRVLLLRQFAQVVQQLVTSLEREAPEATPAVEADPIALPLEQIQQAQDEDPRVLELRQQALCTLDTRRLDDRDYTVLWFGAIELWRRSVVVCMAADVEGRRRMLGMTEGSMQDLTCMRRFFDGIIQRKLCFNQGLICVLPGASQLTKVLLDRLGGAIKLQYCQLHRRRRVTSFLSDPLRLRVQAALYRAYLLPDATEAHAALMQVHATLMRANRSAAQQLMLDMERTLTLHTSGMVEKICPSLRHVTCITHTLRRQLQRRLRDVRTWLPPEERRAAIALSLLEIEGCARRIAHASCLAPLREALFTTPPIHN